MILSILGLKEKDPDKNHLPQKEPFGKLTIYQAVINIKCHFLDSGLQFSLKRNQTNKFRFPRTSRAAGISDEENRTCLWLKKESVVLL
jgi:hypothetical protein